MLLKAVAEGSCPSSTALVSMSCWPTGSGTGVLSAAVPLAAQVSLPAIAQEGDPAQQVPGTGLPTLDHRLLPGGLCQHQNVSEEVVAHGEMSD